MINTDYIGKVAYSKSGRDEGRLFIILSIINDEFVYISDGDLRTVEKPKKKKIKHLDVKSIKAEEISKLLQSGEEVTNNMVRKFLQSMNSNEEV